MYQYWYIVGYRVKLHTFREGKGSKDDLRTMLVYAR